MIDEEVEYRHGAAAAATPPCVSNEGIIVYVAAVYVMTWSLWPVRGTH